MLPFLPFGDRTFYEELHRQYRCARARFHRTGQHSIIEAQLATDICWLLTKQQVEHWPSRAIAQRTRLIRHYRRAAIRAFDC